MSISLQALVTQAVIITLIYSVVKYRYLSPLRTCPGPFWASLSNAWKFYHYMKGDLNVVEQTLHKRDGPVIRTGPTTLSFSSRAAFEAIYSENAGLEKGDFYGFARQPMTGEYNVFSARTRSEHQQRRQLVSTAFTSSHIQSMEPCIVRHIQRFLSKLEIASEYSIDRVVDVANNVQELVMNTLIEVIFGPQLAGSGQSWTETARGEGVLSAFPVASKFGWGISYLPMLASFMAFPPLHKWLRKPTLNADGIQIGISGLTSRAKTLILENPESITGESQPSIAKSLLQARRGTSGALDPLDVYNECFNLLFMGPGSTTAAIVQCLYELGGEDGLDWQRRIRKDLAQDAKPRNSEALDAVIRETLRHSTPFTAAFPREIRAGAETAVPGLQAPLPRGTIVGANTWIVSHDEGSWGDDALQWEPERWLNKKPINNKGTLSDQSVAFGKGPRSCLGEDLALSLVMQTVAMLLSKWEIERAGGFQAGAWLETQVDRCELRLKAI